MDKNLDKYLLPTVTAFVDLFVLSAPWLVFGFVMAAFIKAFFQTEAMHKHLGGTGPWATIKAALIGAPLPLCSCGVVPAALGLRSAGASKNATVSFLVATPETGVDSVSFTYALMGPVMAIVRPIAAVTSAIVSGLLVGQAEVSESKVDDKEESEATSCCASKEETSSCESSKQEQSSEPGAAQRLQEGLQFAFGKMLRDVVNWLLIGLVVAAVVQAWLPDDFFKVLGDGFLSMLLMAVIGIPMYVCASASTPIAAGFLLAGLSPGAVLVFMLLGPASNIGTLMIVKKELGRRAMTAYIVGLVLSAFAFGFALNYLAGIYAWDMTSTLQAHQHDQTSVFEWFCATVLAVFVVKAFAQTNFPHLLKS